MSTTFRKLHRAIQNKRRDMLSRGIVLIHDNARPQTANVTQRLLMDFDWGQLDYLLVIFIFFLHMKSFLSGQNFDEDNGMKEAVWVHSWAASFYDDGIQKLVSCYDKCLINDGNYVEKCYFMFK